MAQFQQPKCKPEAPGYRQISHPLLSCLCEFSQQTSDTATPKLSLRTRTCGEEQRTTESTRLSSMRGPPETAKQTIHSSSSAPSSMALVRHASSRRPTSHGLDQAPRSTPILHRSSVARRSRRGRSNYALASTRSSGRSSMSEFPAHLGRFRSLLLRRHRQSDHLRRR